MRSIFGLSLDFAASPTNYVAPVSLPFTATQAGLTFNKVDEAYSPYEQLKKISVDPYVSITDAGMEIRRSKVNQHILNRNLPYIPHSDEEILILPEEQILTSGKVQLQPNATKQEAHEYYSERVPVIE